MRELAINLDFKLDESYTPNRLSVRAGTSTADMKEIRAVELEEPTGWVVVPLRAPGSMCASSAPLHGWRPCRARTPALQAVPAGSSAEPTHAGCLTSHGLSPLHRGSYTCGILGSDAGEVACWQ